MGCHKDSVDRKKHDIIIFNFRQNSRAKEVFEMDALLVNLEETTFTPDILYASVDFNTAAISFIL